ncbi:MAG: hypothetical protein CTR53_16255 [Ferrovibrio sp.]|nr:MAG: hypothetical protein CTR53_16255 [Ferrovibrio sp.]
MGEVFYQFPRLLGPNHSLSFQLAEILVSEFGDWRDDFSDHPITTNPNKHIERDKVSSSIY